MTTRRDGRRALAEIDLGAVQHNVRRLRSLLPSGCRLCAVVKADAYGHGAVPVARAAVAAGASFLGVATVEEAEELRAAGLDTAVLVFAPLTGDELSRAAAAGADVSVWSRRFAAEAMRLGLRGHVELDSGMCRTGTDEETLVELATGLAGGPSQLVGLMSHFATDLAEDPEFRELQLSRFLAVRDRLRRHYPGVIAHIASSEAVIHHPESHCDMVRTGCAIYGLSPMFRDPADDGLRPVLRLSSYLAASREIERGESIGYGREFIAERRMRIGLVPMGYADGVPRPLAHGGRVLIDGRPCPVVGKISMDSMTVELPEDGGVPGADVVIVGESGGERILMEDVQEVVGRWHVEITTCLGSRVRRRYVALPAAELLAEAAGAPATQMGEA